nr:ATPdependent DNA ligase EC 6511 clustered with Ku protein LigD CDS [Bradyrhizobium sp.]
MSWPRDRQRRCASLSSLACEVDYGLDNVSTADLQRQLKPLIRKTHPYAKRIAYKGISGKVGRRNGETSLL